MDQPIEFGREPLFQNDEGVSEANLRLLEQRILALHLIGAAAQGDETIARIGAELDQLEAELCRAVPRTLSGVAVKIRHLWASARDGADANDELNLRTILEALGRLADGAESPSGFSMPGELTKRNFLAQLGRSGEPDREPLSR